MWLLWVPAVLQPSRDAKQLAWQNVSFYIRWTSEQWLQPGAAGGYLKL